MKITREVPVQDTKRTRKVFALLPMFFNHGSINKPLRTLVWFDYYYVEERYSYNEWVFCGRKLNYD